MFSFNLNAQFKHFACNGSTFVFEILDSFKIDFLYNGIKVGEYSAELKETSTLWIIQSKEGYTLKRFDDNQDIADLIFITITDSSIYIQELL